MSDKQIRPEILRVLSLEDSLLDFEMIRFQLLHSGYNLDLCRVETESEFVSFLHQNSYDIILADYNLPSFDALGALHFRNQICPDTPFICVSGTIGEDKAIELLKLGADDYVLKDRPERLPYSIDRALKEVKEKEIKRNAEIQLRKLSSAVEQSPASVVITDTFGTIEYVNKKFCEITGYSQEECMGKNPRILKSGKQNKTFYENMWKSILSGKEWEGEMMNRMKDGRFYWEHASIAPIMDENGAISHFVAVKEDISKQKRNDQIQQTINNISNAALSAIGMDELIGVVGAELGKLVYITNFYIAFYQSDSGIFSTWFGIDEKDQIESWPAKRSTTGLVIKNQQSVLLYDTDIEKLIEAGEVDMIGTPSKVWLGVPLWENKEIFGVLVLQSYDNRDAYNENDKVMLEYIAQEISLAILRKRAERYLIFALRKAEESDRLKSAFLNNLSHEIRTPMNGILGFSDLLKEPGLTGEQQKEYIGIIEQSGARMLNIINDIVSMSKIDAGLTVLNISKTNVNLKIELFYKSFKQKSEEKRIELFYKNELPSTAAIIDTDEEKLDMVLNNLIENAFKFTKQGSIEFGYSLIETLHATSLQTHATSLQTHEKSPQLQFFVKDTGVGIPKERQSAVFERFMQADYSNTKPYQGAGLGLSISKAYVEMLGGAMWLESEEGQGTTIYFMLPYKSVSHKKSILVDRSDENSIKGSPQISIPSLLIVEDDKISELLLRNTFKKFCKNIVSVNNGLEAVEQCRLHDFDLIMMDIKLPDKNGDEVVREIRQFNDKVVIVAQTAFKDYTTQEKAMQAGCNYYVSKPINKEKLIELIHNHFFRK